MRHAPGVHLLLRSPDPGSGPGASFIRKAPRAQLNLRSGVLPHPDDRSRVAAPERQVADEAVPARTAQQEQPGDVGVRPPPSRRPAGASSPGTGPRRWSGCASRNRFPWRGSSHAEIRVVSFECGTPFQRHGHATYC